MEDGLVPLWQEDLSQGQTVLILIVVDNGLVLQMMYNDADYNV